MGGRWAGQQSARGPGVANELTGRWPATGEREQRVEGGFVQAALGECRGELGTGEAQVGAAELRDHVLGA